VSIYDPVSETWRRGPSMITARAGFAAAATPTMILVAGGEVITTDPWRVVSGVEGIAAGSNRWSEMPSLPMSVHGLGAGVIRDNAFYVLGGSGLAGGVNNAGKVQVLRW